MSHQLITIKDANDHKRVYYSMTIEEGIFVTFADYSEPEIQTLVESEYLGFEHHMDFLNEKVSLLQDLNIQNVKMNREFANYIPPEKRAKDALLMDFNCLEKAVNSV